MTTTKQYKLVKPLIVNREEKKDGTVTLRESQAKYLKSKGIIEEMDNAKTK